MLFHRVQHAFNSQPFRAKANPFNSQTTAGEEHKEDAAAAFNDGRAHHHALSPPASGAGAPHSASRVAGGSSGGGGGARVLRSAGSASPDAPWKAHLKQQCMNRVKQQRSSLQQKLRNLSAPGSDTPVAPAAAMTAATAAQAAHASEALAHELRGIIQEQYAEQRSNQHVRSSPFPAGAAAAASSSSAAAAASSSYASAASSFSSSASARGATSDSDRDRAFMASFSPDEDEFLTQDELLDLMAELEEEVRREEEEGGSMSMMEETQLQHDGRPTNHVAAASSSSAAATSPFRFGASASSSSAAATASSSSSSAFASSPQQLQLQQQQQQQWLAAAYDAEAAAQMEADMEALQEYESQRSHIEVILCPVCHTHSVTVSSGSALGSSAASCSRCGLRYLVDSAADFRQHLSDAVELHASRCAAAPKFLSPHYAPRPVAAAAASSASSSSSSSAVPSASLALACEACQTWLTLPVLSNGGWGSHPSSQADPQQQEDQEMES